LHVDWMHLFFNMFTLYSFGEFVVNRYGSLGFLLIYFGSLLLGNVFALLLHSKNPYYSAVGASGAVSGVLFCTVLLEPMMKILVFFIPMPAWIFALIYLAYTVYGLKSSLGNIGHSAHLGGAVGGVLCTIMLSPDLLFHHSWTIILLVALFLALLFITNQEKR
jgi:membrane associated rhomboid family serine protease